MAAVLPVLAVIAQVASAGVGIASAAGAFDKGGGGGDIVYGGTVREPKDQTEALEAEKMRRLRMGRAATVLTTSRGALGEAEVYKPGLKAKLGA